VLWPSQRLLGHSSEGDGALYRSALSAHTASDGSRHYGVRIVSEEFLSESEILLYAEQFCLRMEASASAIESKQDRHELLLKVNQSRGLLKLLQQAFDENELEILNGVTAQLFHTLLCTLHWCAFYSRRVIDRSTFRHLIMVQVGFTLLLVRQMR
jgi:stress-induced morphogen